MKLVWGTLQKGTLATTLFISAFHLQDFNIGHNKSQSGFTVLLIHCFSHAAKFHCQNCFWVSKKKKKNPTTPNQLHLCIFSYSYCLIWSLPDKPIVIQFIDWVLRGISQVMFVNNPLSGLVVVAGFLVQNPWWTLTGCLGTMVSTLTALILGQDR